MIRSTLLALFIGACTLPSWGQWGVRGTILHWETISPRGLWNFMGGLDHDLNERLSVGLDFTTSFNLFGYEEYEQGTYNGISVEYSLQRKAMGLTYRSCYFLADNDDGAAFYLGPFIGFRKVTYDVYPHAYYSYDTPAWARPETGTTTLFPVGMRMGWRSALEGLTGDIYFGVGSQLGDKDIVKAPYLLKKDLLSGLFLQFGYCLGVGW